MNYLLKELRAFEKNHRMLSFILVMVSTILLTRSLVFIQDPHPIILGFELHHFDYGLILVLITQFFLLFGNKHLYLYLLISAIGTGFIVDDFWFIRSNIEENLTPYFNPIPVIFFTLLVLILIWAINKNHSKKEYR